jgi:sulfite reductase (NADPH) hemoprotein beta-component
VTASRGLGAVLGDWLATRPELIAAARCADIKISGCPHGCGQHYIGGIGFQGGMRKVRGRAVPQYLVYVGGGTRPDGSDFGRLVGKIPARKATATLERLLALFIAESNGAGHHFWATIPLPRLRALLADLFELSDDEAVEADFIDLGDSTTFETITAEGECAA